MTTDTAAGGAAAAATAAISAYAPIRRNSFLHYHPSSSAATTTTITNRLSTLTLCLTLVLIRFWKDSRLWQDVMARLPPSLQGLLGGHLRQWHGTTTGLLSRLVRRLLQGLHEQLSPFLFLSSSSISRRRRSLNKYSQQQQQQPRGRTNSGSDGDVRGGGDDAPTSILCDLSSTDAQFTTQTFLLSNSDYYEDRIRQNHCLIRKVLQYWFGQCDPDEAQKKLWMIASSSAELRQQVDAEIADLFTPLLCELATAAAATACEDTTNGGSTQQQQQSSSSSSSSGCRWKQWCADKDLYGYSGKLAAIIVLDQFSRHIRRHYEETSSTSTHHHHHHHENDHDENHNNSDKNNNDDDDASNHSSIANNNNQSQSHTTATATSTTATTTTSSTYTAAATLPLPPQTVLDSLALRTAQLFTVGHGHEIQCGMIPIPQYIFGLMPYRHASTIDSVQYVQTCVEQMTHLNTQFDTMTNRFRKATNRRMAVLQDEARRRGKQQQQPQPQQHDNNDKATAVAAAATTTTTTLVETIASQDNSEQQQQQQPQEVIERPEPNNNNATNSLHFSEEDILETFPFDADMTDAPDYPVVKTMEAFLNDRGIHPTTTPPGNQNTTTKTKTTKKQKKGGITKQKGGNHHQRPQLQLQQQQKPIATQQPPPPPNTKDPPSSCCSSSCSLIVSLSGGVDSMVIASVLAYLKTRRGGYAQLDVVAIHIDYANRPESQAESDYVQKYCAQLGIRFVVRRIEEVTRGITARDEYEQRARQVRYDMYRTVAKDCCAKNNNNRRHYQCQEQQQQQQQGAALPVVGVMLGHHRGDLRENVLSNAHKGCGPLDLSGMTAVSQNDGVTIYRPLLPLEKRDVFDYAHRFGVPYFKDTTPHWSTRGKLRNKLLPLLEEIYGEGSMNNLSTLAVESDECRELLHDALLKPFMDRVIRRPMGIVFETAPFVAQARGLFFWKFVLREVLHSAGLGMFSDKSVASFLERIGPGQTAYNNKKAIREGWLQCRRDYAVYLQADGKVFVFYPASFPWRKADAYKCAGQVLDIGQQNTTAVGPWIVEAEVCGYIDAEREKLVKKKAVSSMDQFMEGFVEYYLEVPTVKEATEQEEEGTDAATKYTPAQLLFVSSFRKITRPPAWKNTDEKIQEIIPLLGISDESLQELKNPVDENPVALVRVTLDRRFSSD